VSGQLQMLATLHCRPQKIKPQFAQAVKNLAHV